MAAEISASDTSTIRATFCQIASIAKALGNRHARPSAIAVCEGASTTLRCAKLSAYDGDASATTPTISVGRASALRAAATPQIDEPKPMGTYTRSSGGAASNNSIAYVAGPITNRSWNERSEQHTSEVQ